MSILFNLTQSGSNGGGVHPEGAHQQSESELKEHIAKLVEEYKANHPIAPNASVVRKKMREEKAKQWAIGQEPHRNLPYLLESMQGVKADTKPRTVNGTHYQGRSSWVESIEQPDENHIVVHFKDNTTGYNFDAYPRNVEKLLKSPSIGSELSKAIWHTGNTSGVSSHGDRRKKENK